MCSFGARNGRIKQNETINKQHKNDSADRSSVLYVTLSCIEFIGGSYGKTKHSRDT